MDAIEEAVPPNSIDFIAESTLSLLREPNLKRLKHNGFKALLPGIESWYELGNKSKTGKKQGMDKVRQTSDHVNMILRYIPYVQINFVLGLDADLDSNSFELTKRFVDMTPGAFPGYSLLSAFGQASKLNLELQHESRIIPFPFHFLDNNKAINVRPKNCSWTQFYDHVVDLTRYTFSWRSIYRRHQAVAAKIPKWMNFVRAVSSEGFGRSKYYAKMRRLLDSDRPLRRFFEQETLDLPQFYINRVRQDLGPLWKHLPEGALEHDPNAYLKAEQQANLKTSLDEGATETYRQQPEIPGSP